MASFTELPKPNLGDINTLQFLIKANKKSPTQLNMTYVECCALDTIQVTIVPEKKGIFLKHVEYEISSVVGIMWQQFAMFPVIFAGSK